MSNVLDDVCRIGEISETPSRFSELEDLCSYQLHDFSSNTDLLPKDDLLQEGDLCYGIVLLNMKEEIFRDSNP